jgi:hypothetical protein
MLGFEATGRLALGQISASRSFSASVVTASFTLSGQDVVYAINATVDAGSFTLNGQDMGLNAALAIGAASFVLTWPSFNFVSTRRRPLFIRGSSYWKGSN